MGQLIYEQRSSYEVDDRVLAHLRLVAMNKLRRQESFMLQLPHRDVGHVSLWIAPAIPIGFHFWACALPHAPSASAPPP